MLIVVMGRTCSGKDTFANCLEQAGLRRLITSTTRPCRGPGDNKYRFLSREQAAKIPENTKFLKTIINQNEYFAVRDEIDDGTDTTVTYFQPVPDHEMVHEKPEKTNLPPVNTKTISVSDNNKTCVPSPQTADFVILDPNGLYQLQREMPDLYIRPVYVYATPGARAARSHRRGDKNFEIRNAAETARFDEFESSSMTEISDIILNNELRDIQIMKDASLELAQTIRAHKVIREIIRNVQPATKNHVAPDLKAGHLIQNPEELGQFILEWLKNDPSPEKIFLRN